MAPLLRPPPKITIACSAPGFEELVVPFCLFSKTLRSSGADQLMILPNPFVSRTAKQLVLVSQIMKTLKIMRDFLKELPLFQ